MAGVRVRDKFRNRPRKKRRASIRRAISACSKARTLTLASGVVKREIKLAGRVAEREHAAEEVHAHAAAGRPQLEAGAQREQRKDAQLLADQPQVQAVHAVERAAAAGAVEVDAEV